MGEVAMWTGIVTGTMMLVSPTIFKRMGWKGVAKATPNFLCWTGVPFFVGCITLAFLRPTTAAPLTLLVGVGAVLQVHPFYATFISVLSTGAVQGSVQKCICHNVSICLDCRISTALSKANDWLNANFVLIS